ncbi:SGNH/GDSL hydrolase family protein [Spirillospora sp. CA-294931]|uniref:SGNH/GDSL hydrolase family protein n=1 Tax=Spirillospora sp. CA-294931 TaxID=3240042 RepID=UPI003D93DB97
MALGDSYSSGTGAGEYDRAAGRCKRSAKAYPRLWATARRVDSFQFVACSGARTTDVINRQLSALNARTTLVTVTAGGNDARFGRTMETCVLRSAAECGKAVGAAERYVATVLPGRLAALYAAIRKKAPRARVVVLGYPRLYTGAARCSALARTRRVALNRAADALTAGVGRAAANAGFDFADVRDEFAGHELCSGDGWLRAVSYPVGDSFHPTSLGQRRGYLVALRTVGRGLPDLR